MDTIFIMDGGQLNYLYPLKKWRLLDLNSLQRESQYPGTYSGFKKLIQKLEKRDVLNSFRLGESRRKYVFLTKRGGAQVGLDSAALNISTETLLHDLKVAQVCRSLLDLRAIKKVELEHEIILEKGKNQYTPDALVYFENKGDAFQMAFELELTRKSKSKYLDKISFYLKSNYYDYVLYFFNDRGVMDSYKKHVQGVYGAESFEKILLALNTNMNNKNPKFEESLVFFMGKEVQLKDIFNK
jgi:hypothetical protein